MIFFSNNVFCPSYPETKICLPPPPTLGALKMSALVC